MTIDDLLRILGSVALIGAAVPANRIVWLYRRVPWYRSVLGRALFTFALGCALVLDLAVLGSLLLYLDIRPLWFEALRLAVFGIVFAGLWLVMGSYARILREATGTRHRPDEGRHTLDDEVSNDG